MGNVLHGDSIQDKNGFTNSVLAHMQQPEDREKDGICDSKSKTKHQTLQVSDVSSSEEETRSLSFVTGQVFKVLRYAFFTFKDYVKHCIATLAMLLAVVTIACAIRGDILFFAMVTHKTYAGNFGGKVHQSTDNETIAMTQEQTDNSYISDKPAPILPEYLQLPSEYNLQDALYYIFVSNASALIIYHLVCGFLQIYFYELQRKEPEKWKCQPHRFLTRSNELHEVVTGTINLILLSVFSGSVTCWIVNGKYSTMYFKFDEYGYAYLSVSVAVLFLWFEGSAYYIHAVLHWPWVYKNVHKHHHRYHAPTAYSAVAMSPIELFMLYFAFMAPPFLVPINGLVFVVELVYVYYFSLIDHSGIKMTSIFPWQPDTMFHDDHHRYFHCNFGFNSYLFDWLHGTLRRKDRTYGEDVFWGRGKKKKERIN